MAGGPLTSKVAEVQESCVSQQATLMNVPPGDYIIELDSRAVTPAVRSSQTLQVEAGEDAEVMFSF